MKKILSLRYVIPALMLSGCGHNAVQYSDGIGMEMGFIPEKYSVSLNFRYGKILSAVMRENSKVKLKTETGNALEAAGSPENQLNSMTELSVNIGEQANGYKVKMNR